MSLCGFKGITNTIININVVIIIIFLHQDLLLIVSILFLHMWMVLSQQCFKLAV